MSIIQNAISKLVKGKTLIVVAHRLATIQKAEDQITCGGKWKDCWLRQAEEELYQECPLYQKIME